MHLQASLVPKTNPVPGTESICVLQIVAAPGTALYKE